MTATVLNGHRTWGATRDAEGEREYTVTHLVKTDDTRDGPSVVMTLSALPQPGQFWAIDNDLDSWAFCTTYMKISILNEKEGDPNTVWRVDQKFSTKRDSKRCQDTTIENPLLEPMTIAGSFVKYTQEVMQDKDGDLIRSSSYELLRGPQVEFDFNRPTVSIGQNVINLQLNVFSEMVDRVNDAPLWGLPKRCIKLSNVSWERLVYGSCNFYYHRQFEFDVRFDTFDKIALDEGTKALGRLDPTTGTWDSVSDFAPGVPIDVTNPLHYTKYKDKNGENARVILNGSGVPIETESDVGEIEIEYYQEDNFLVLGIPTSL